MTAKSRSQKNCNCGFGEDYNTVEKDKIVCAVCKGLVKKDESPDEPSQGTPAEEKKTVLLIDDRDSFRSRVEKMLTVEGYTVLDADNGLSGIKIITDMKDREGTPNASTIDVILLDLIMPGALDGVRTLATIKTIAPEIPVIILTATPPKKELLNQLSDLGAKKYLNKTAENMNALILKNIRSLG